MSQTDVPLEELRDSVATFMTRRAAPVVEEAEKTGCYPRALMAEAGAAGFFGCAFPERVGGTNLGFRAAAIVAEETAGAVPQLSTALNQQAMSCPYTILRYGEPRVAEPIVRDLIAGQRIGVWSLTEAGGGSDPINAVRTRAERTSAGYLLNGAKMFATGADQADAGVLFARTSSDLGRRSLTAFIVEPRKSAAWSARPIAFDGLSRVFNSCEVEINDLEVPREALLGEEGMGFEIAMQALIFGRLSVAARALGVAKACLAEGVAHTSMRKIRGVTLANFQTIQVEMGEVDSAIFAAEAALVHTAAMMDRREPCNRATAIAKYVCARAAKLATEVISPMFGGYGLASDMRITRLRAYANLFDIGEGAPHVQKILIGQHALNIKNADRYPVNYLDA